MSSPSSKIPAGDQQNISNNQNIHHIAATDQQYKGPETRFTVDEATNHQDTPMARWLKQAPRDDPWSAETFHAKWMCTDTTNASKVPSEFVGISSAVVSARGGLASLSLDENELMQLESDITRRK